MEQSKPLERLNHPLIRDHPERGEEQEVFRVESDGLFNTGRSGSQKGCLVYYGRGNLIFCHHAEPRVKLYMPKEESFPIPMKYIDVARTTHKSLDVLLERHVDYWKVDGERELSDAWTGFTRIILLNERSLDGFSWSGRRLMRKQTTSRPDNVWPDMWKHVWWSEKQSKKWAIEKPKLENARQTRGIFFIEPEDEEFKHENFRGKLEIPMPAAIPCKTPTNDRGETCRSIGEHMTKYACIVDADESMRIPSEGVPHR